MLVARLRIALRAGAAGLALCLLLAGPGRGQEGGIPVIKLTSARNKQPEKLPKPREEKPPEEPAEKAPPRPAEPPEERPLPPAPPDALFLPGAPPAHLAFPPGPAPPFVVYTYAPFPPAPPPPAPFGQPKSPSAWGDGVLLWARPEVGVWWTRSQPVPALATNPSNGRVALGGRGGDGDPRVGGRIFLGAWLGESQRTALQVDYLCLASASESLRADFDGSVPLARPFVDRQTGRASARLVGFPGQSSGSLVATPSSSAVQSVGVDLRNNVAAFVNPAGEVALRVDLLGGYRYLGIDEGLRVAEDSVALSGASAGVHTRLVDNFRTRNRFNGVDLGVVSEYRDGPFWLEMTGKVAVGYLDQDFVIDGSRTVVGTNAARATTPGGLLAAPGAYTRSTATVLPELGLVAGWQVRRNVRVYAGYSVLYLPGVLRPGDQAEPGRLARQQANNFDFNAGDVWLQGLRFGVEVSY